LDIDRITLAFAGYKLLMYSIKEVRKKEKKKCVFINIIIFKRHPMVRGM
jgi:hypothetical protein